MRCVGIAGVVTMGRLKTYSEMLRYQSFEDRLAYLRLEGDVGLETFGSKRYLNQAFYKSKEWQRCRNLVILRDCGCDLGIEDRPIYGRIYIHHINPIDVCAVSHSSVDLLDLDNLVCVTLQTHNAIHYGSDMSCELMSFLERSKNDTVPWKR